MCVLKMHYKKITDVENHDNDVLRMFIRQEDVQNY